MAVCTYLFIDLIPVKRDRIEQAVDRAQRAKIPAKWPIYHKRQHDQCDQDQVFPNEQKSRSLPDAFIHDYQRPPGHQVPDGQNPFAEPWFSCPTKSRTNMGGS
jgi:hypothetical protein